MNNKNSILKIILATGLIAGTLDITMACLKYYFQTEKSPVNVLNFVASGLIGKDAFSGQNYTPLLGLFLHYSIAFIWVIVFYFLYPTLKRFIESKYLLAVFYGIFVWTIMNFVVVPLSNTTKLPFNPTQAVINAIILIFAIGLPCSFLTAKFYSIEKK